MRPLGLSLLLIAGCAETGAHLTFSAPDGPTRVTSFRVVLAAPDVVPTIAGQRVGPDTTSTHSVAYYLQRTVAGGTHDAHGAIDGVDGFAVRIAPDSSTAETQFIPFVLMYDAGDRIVGMATFRASEGAMPSPIRVVRDEIGKYVLDVEPVVQVGDTDAVSAAQVHVVECHRDDQSTFASGVVWRPRNGPEIRLVLPDDGGLDATQRALDLDCDGHPVAVDGSGADCDDSRAWFHREARETCDGYDTNCDGQQHLVVACPAGSGGNVCGDPATNTGLALCDDRTGEQGACQSDPQCLCAASPNACTRCLVSAELGAASNTIKPCQPGIGYAYLDGCAETERCPRVEVLAVGGGWKAELSHDVMPHAFGHALTGVGPKILLRVRRPEGDGAEIAGTRGASTGEVVLGVTLASGASYLKAIDLQIAGDGATCEGTVPYQMYCTP